MDQRVSGAHWRLDSYWPLVSFGLRAQALRVQETLCQLSQMSEMNWLRGLADSAELAELAELAEPGI